MTTRRRSTSTTRLFPLLLLVPLSPTVIHSWIVPSPNVVHKTQPFTSAAAAASSSSPSTLVLLAKYDLGLGKHRPKGGNENSDSDDDDGGQSDSDSDEGDDDDVDASLNVATTASVNFWNVPAPVQKPKRSSSSSNTEVPQKQQQQQQHPRDAIRRLTRNSGTTNNKSNNRSNTKLSSSLTPKYSVMRKTRGSNKKHSIRTKKLVSRSEETKRLRGAVWDEEHYQASSLRRQQQDDSIVNGDVRVQQQQVAKHHKEDSNDDINNDSIVSVGGNMESSSATSSSTSTTSSFSNIRVPNLLYPNIDLSIPESVYSNETDAVWDLLRYEAYREAQREPLLVSFLYSTILNHASLEGALAFHLANRLSSPAMISTQIQALILEALHNSWDFRRSLRADVMAVRDRDPACTCLPDAFLYFKGFQALQTHRVAHYLYRQRKQVVLAHYLQSQSSQTFQIDIHPNATLGSGIMLDHGTGIVIGETATVGHNCSILHHVTLGGSGRRGNDRHPKIGSGVLLGAGASVLGNVHVGDGCQVGAGTLVISDLPPHSVAVGVPSKIIGSFVDVTEQPSIGMNQMTGTRDFDEHIITFESGGI